MQPVYWFAVFHSSCNAPKQGSLLTPSCPDTVRCLWKHGPQVFSTAAHGARLMSLQFGEPEHTAGNESLAFFSHVFLESLQMHSVFPSPLSPTWP